MSSRLTSASARWLLALWLAPPALAAYDPAGAAPSRAEAEKAASHARQPSGAAITSSSESPARPPTGQPEPRQAEATSGQAATDAQPQDERRIRPHPTGEHTANEPAPNETAPDKPASAAPPARASGSLEPALPPRSPITPAAPLLPRPAPLVLTKSIDPDDPQLIDQSQWLLMSESLDSASRGRGSLAPYGLRLRGRAVYPSLGFVVSRFVLPTPAGASPEELLNRIRQDHPQLLLEFNRHYVPLDGSADELSRRLDAALEQPHTYGWALTGATDPDCLRHAAGRHIGMLDGAVNDRLDGSARGVIVAHDVTGLNPPPTNHATAIAGLLLGPNALTPGAQLHAIAIFAEDDRQRFVSQTEWVLRGLDYLLTLRPQPDAINLSFGGPPSALLTKAFELSSNQSVLVAAAGNSGPGTALVFPASLGGVLAVTAVGPHGHIYGSASHGAELAAPGVDVLSISVGGKPTYVTGTSFATPWVAAAAVLARARNRTASPAALRDQLLGQALDLGAPGADEIFGQGLVDLKASCAAPKLD